MRNLINKMVIKTQAFTAADKGATAIEYGLIAAGIAVAISVVVFTFGSNLASLFSNMATAVAK